MYHISRINTGLELDATIWRSDKLNFMLCSRTKKINQIKLGQAKPVSKIEVDYITHTAIDNLLRDQNFGCMIEYIEADCPRMLGFTIVAKKYNINQTRLSQLFATAVRKHKHPSRRRNRLDIILGFKK